MLDFIHSDKTLFCKICLIIGDPKTKGLTRYQIQDVYLEEEIYQTHMPHYEIEIPQLYLP